MVKRAGLLVLVALAPVWPALAQDRPPDVPTRDVTATYRVEGGPPGAGPQTIRMSYKVNGDRMRIDEDHVTYTIMDGASRRTYVVNVPEKAYFQVPFDPDQERGALPPGTKFTRMGTDTVAGLPCTIWRAQIDSSTSSACITSDGVMLRSEQPGPEGAVERLVATSVEYGPPPDSLFQPPAGYTRVQAPPMGPGGMPGGAGPGAPGGGMPGGPPPER